MNYSINYKNLLQYIENQRQLLAVSFLFSAITYYLCIRVIHLNFSSIIHQRVIINIMNLEISHINYMTFTHYTNDSMGMIYMDYRL